jgi:hypothetical protein
MKRASTLLSLLSLCWALNGQVVFQHDFESGMAPMTLIDADGKTPHPNVAAYPLAWNIASPAFGNGTNVAISNSWYNPPGVADDWMITPALAITDSATILAWEAKAQDASFPDGYQVRVSTTGMGIADFTDVIFNIAQEAPSWQERFVSLAAYVGDTIHIAFRNNSNDMFLLLIDNIIVQSILANDAALTQLSTVRFHELNSPIEIAGTFRNNGSSPLTSLDITWSYAGESYTDNLSGLNVAPGATYEFTHSTPFTVEEAISYEIEVSISNPNGEDDGDPQNNVSSMLVSGVTYVPSKRVVIEEGTGSWCGWCPRGHVAMEYMRNTYPETFIGIAVHNGDPMVFAEYDNNIGLTGYPSANANRVLNDVSVSQNDFVSFHNNLLQRIAPIDVDVEAVYDPTNRVATINVHAGFVTQLDDIDYRFSVVIMQDSVKGTGSGYNQVNFYSFQSQNIPLVGAGHNWQQATNPVPAASMFYNDVARSILGGYFGQAGIIPASVVAGDVVEHTYTYNVPASYNPMHMSAVVLLLDGSTGEILNAKQAEFDFLVNSNEAFINEKVQIFPNPAKGNINIEVQLEEAAPVRLDVFNMLGQQVASQVYGMQSGRSILPFNASHLPAGGYSFYLHLGNKLAVKKVIVE